MKKWLGAAVAALIVTAPVQANTQDYKLITVAGYLNFYLLNINACQDFHPAVRQAAYDAEKQLYPWLDKLHAKLGDGQQVAQIVLRRRAMLNEQISEGDFTLDHCLAIVKILNEDGLDKTLLASLD
ncbi:hypothetical protein WG68_05315 [Arsukibacterium ikkense]|uniref:Uncharacterized protein n=1 Tax=Arsukibacterium ikkense TaxID=336831 RepID=A0A0M2V795_9GAMM|nr:hypothetical protein [Arsukibacterium ikkense]KKO46702.1 hypothetical protein WG68_05315 [Arsukibacterium ikkense]